MKTAVFALAVVLALALTFELCFGDSGQSRLTFYTDYGVMADGNVTYVGAAACGEDYDFGTILLLPGGMTVTCEDRGLLASNQIDVYAPTYEWGLLNITEGIGDYVTPVVLRWGWGNE